MGQQTPKHVGGSWW